MAFISLAKHSRGNEEVNTTSVSTASTNVPTASANIGVIDKDDMEEMDIKWNMALLSMRADRAPRSQKRGRRDNFRQGSKVEEQAPKALMTIDGVGWDWSYMANDEKNHALVADKEAPTEFALMANTSAESKDMSWTGLPEFKDDTVTDYSRPAPIVESSPDDAQNKNPSVTETEASPSTISPKSFIKFVKANDSPINSKTDKAETAKKPSVKKFHTGGTKFSTANMGKKRKAVKPSACWFWKPLQNLSNKGLNSNNVSDSSQKNIDDKGYWDSGCSRYMTGNISCLSDYEPFDGGYVSFGQGGCKITGKGTIKTGKLEFENVYFVKDLKKFHTCNTKFSTADMGNKGKAINASACWIWKPTQNLSNKGNSQNHIDDKGYWDSGCSRYMTGNISYLSDYETFDGGYVSFGQGGCKITCKGTIKTGKLEFKNVYFVKDLKYNLFSVSQICNNKNSVLFTDSKCIVLGRDFKLADDTNVLLRTPRQHNMYSIDLNNIVPHKDLTCLVAKASADEWKFEEKGDEVYFIGYPMSSKAFKVFNKRTKRVEENLHVEFLENKAIEKGAGPNCKPQDDCSTDVPESNRNSNPTATSTNPSADQLETLTVETPIPTVSSPVLTACFIDSQEPSSDTILISKRVANQVETPSLDNILTLTNRFEDILGVTTNPVDSDGVKADVSNMETTITASPTPTLRIHKDHPKSQIIGLVDTPIQTRNKSKEVGEQKPKKISYALQDPSWVESMQEELLQFKIQNVWTLVDCPKGVRPIGEKWVLKNKKDERGIVIRNKARIVAQGHIQEEGIDYDEVFAPVTRIKAIRLFLAYASFMGFTVYQMDVKSAFLYGTIDEEVYVMRPLGFQNPKFLAKVYKVEKAIRRMTFFSLKTSMYEKFRYSDVRSSNTPMNKENPWGKDKTGKDVDLHLYRSMVGSLMYLAASRPDIMFAVWLWYPKESPFDLVAYSDSDYGGATQDRKSTTGGCQFLGGRLISSQCKKQTIVATSTSKAEYVAAASCCGQVLWIQNQLLDYGDCFEKKLISVDHIHTDENVTDLLTKPFDAGRFQYLVAQPTSPTTPSSPTLPSVTTAPIPTVTPSNTPPLKQYTRRTRIAQSSVLSPTTDEPASPLRDVSQAPRVTSPAADEGSMQQTLDELTALCTKDKEGVGAEQFGDDAPIKGRNLDEGEAAAERVSDDTEEMTTVLTSIDATTVLASKVAEVPIGSGSIPTAGPPAAEVPTGSDVVPTVGLIFATATVIDAQVARELEEQMAREDQRMSEQVARDAEIARIHAEEELQIMIDGLDRSNETVAKYLGMTFEEIEAKFTTVSKQIESFIHMVSKEEAERFKRKGIRFEQESAKKLNTSEEVPKKVKSPDEVPEEKVKEMMQLVLIEEVYVEALQVKHLIIDWKVHTEGQRSYWKVTRLGGSSTSYQFFVDMLKHLDREDLNQLWALVKESLSIRPHTSDKEIKRWVKLKRLYEPDDEDQLWTHTQNLMHALVEWKLYDMCGVHQVTSKDKEIFMLVEKDYPLKKGLSIGMISYKLQVETYSKMANDLILKIYKIASSPRQQGD
uniref:Putative ribonuclease H-like domain-containing protein n=1 Tax=Tanacetum cinerariifolium TaxID=118510 RepID=A0A6L2LWD2_TANCI|nr:putative ribonuclease H-like domain-containing protein [Tanacetum cinerariifolium]